MHLASIARRAVDRSAVDPEVLQVPLSRVTEHDGARHAERLLPKPCQRLSEALKANVHRSRIEAESTRHANTTE